MTELEHGKEISTTLASAQEKHDYFFMVRPNQPVTITFTAPPMEYQVSYVKKELLIDKEGGAAAHSNRLIDFTTTETYEFAELTPHAVYLSIASVKDSMLPSAGYTISMSSSTH